MTPQLFGYAAGIISVACLIPYIRDIFRHTTKPERASWLIWSVLGSIAFSSQYAKGAGDSLWMNGAQTFGAIAVLLLSLRYGVGGFAKRDIFALIAAAFGLMLWFLTKEAAYALFIVIFIDAIGMALTTVKAYEKPESETLISWFAWSLSGVFSMVAVASWDWVLLAYPFYIFVANALTAIAILYGRRHQMK